MNDPREAVAADLGRTLRIQCRIDGEPRTLDSDGQARLTELLRDELGLTGTKVGCNAGDCGACTVLLDGEQACACLVPAAQLDGRELTTVAGLAGLHDAAGRPIGRRLQAAFARHAAAQCGICTPGMLMAAAQLLLDTPHPSEAQAADALGGVLCRCTGYRKILEAVVAAGDDAATLDAPAAVSGAAVGVSVVRLDAAAKLDGSARFGADDCPADALHLRVLRSPLPHARVVVGDLDDFMRGHPGIVGWLSATDIPNNRFAIFPDLRDQPAIADGVARFRGEAVLAIVGSAAAIAALDPARIPVSFEPLAALEEPAAALADEALTVQTRYPDNVLCRGFVAHGDLGATERVAPHRLQASMRTAHVAHAYIEPEAGWARWEQAADGARVTLFVTTQTPYLDRDEIAYMFELPPERVRIVPSAVGGGFGGKLDLSVQPLLVAAARKFGRPARMVFERPESMQASTKRHPATMRARLSSDADGRFAGYAFEADFDTGPYASWGPTVANRVPIHACGPYRFDAVEARTRAVLTHGPIGGAFRGFGVPQSTLLVETLIDSLARELQIDPLELRIRNALRAGDRTATGQVLQASVGLVACLEALRPAWGEARARVAAFNRQVQDDPGASVSTAGWASDPHGITARKRRGVGVAAMWYGIGNTVMANPSTMRVALRADGRLMLYNGAVDIGQGTYTILPQIVADAVGLPLALVDQVHADTGLTLDAGKSSASRQTFVSGNAARLAGESLRRRLCGRLGLPDDPHTRLSVQGGVLEGRNGANIERLVLAALPADAFGDLFVGEGHFDPPTVPLDANGQGVPYATYGFAAQLVELEVDLDLGTVRPLAIHAAHDVGRAINPAQVEGQIHGGIAQGLGLALMERYLSGRTDNLHDYLIPTAGDLPPITVHLIEDPEPLGPYGAKGVGEPALVATAPAILNAIADACGVVLDTVPVTPDRLYAALRARENT